MSSKNCNKDNNENDYWKNLPDRYYLVDRRKVLKVSQGVTVYSLNANGKWTPNQYQYSYLTGIGGSTADVDYLEENDIEFIIKKGFQAFIDSERSKNLKTYI